MSAIKASFFSKNKGLLRQKIAELLSLSSSWFLQTPERALLEAYEAAQNIKKIEIEHFDNQPISPDSAKHTQSVISYWQGYLNKYLTIINLRLAEFRLSHSFINLADTNILEKLQFIDEVISKYTEKPESSSSSPIVLVREPIQTNNSQVNQISDKPAPEIRKTQSVYQKTGIFPRSLGITINKIKTDLTPGSEEEFIKNYRVSRNRTKTALRFFLILILVPLLTQHFSKQLLITPIIAQNFSHNSTRIFLNSEMEEEALEEWKTFEKKLKFASLLQPAPELSPEAIEGKVKDKAIEIAEEFSSKSISAISNVFADLISLITFAIIIAMSKREIVIVKYFLDNIVYGLSDSAKAFLIILFTDIFVGFHSPHGWEVLLEGLSEHLGLPANRSAIFLFIATFPVILDTIVKYWIFRYLSRLSPSALATLKEMNE